MRFKSNRQRKAVMACLRGRGYKKNQFYYDTEHPEKPSMLPYAHKTKEKIFGQNIYIDSKGRKFIKQPFTGRAIEIRSREKKYQQTEMKKREILRKKISESLDAERGCYEKDGKYYYSGTNKELR